jgi:hypothetical protein
MTSAIANKSQAEKNIGISRSYLGVLRRNGTLFEVANMCSKAMKADRPGYVANGHIELLQMAAALQEFRLNGVFPKNDAGNKMAGLVAQEHYKQPLMARAKQKIRGFFGKTADKAYDIKESISGMVQDAKNTIREESKAFGQIMLEYAARPLIEYVAKPVLKAAKIAAYAAGVAIAGVAGAIALEEIKFENTRLYGQLDSGYDWIGSNLPVGFIGATVLAIGIVGTGFLIPKMVRDRKF